jgi:hypothetical protein
MGPIPNKIRGINSFISIVYGDSKIKWHANDKRPETKQKRPTAPVENGDTFFDSRE